MRKIATAKINNAEVKRVILHDSEHGVYVFPCASLQDGSAMGDDWFKSVSDADEYCLEEFGIGAQDWEYLDDPLEGCQQDWIAPVRVKGRDIGKPQWGLLERLENGVWRDFVRVKGRDTNQLQWGEYERFEDGVWKEFDLKS